MKQGGCSKRGRIIPRGLFHLEGESCSLGGREAPRLILRGPPGAPHQQEALNIYEPQWVLLFEALLATPPPWLYAAAFLHEHLGALQLVGGALIVAANVCVGLRGAPDEE